MRVTSCGRLWRTWRLVPLSMHNSWAYVFAPWPSGMGGLSFRSNSTLSVCLSCLYVFLSLVLSSSFSFSRFSRYKRCELKSSCPFFLPVLLSVYPSPVFFEDPTSGKFPTCREDKPFSRNVCPLCATVTTLSAALYRAHLVHVPKKLQEHTGRVDCLALAVVSHATMSLTQLTVYLLCHFPSFA